MVKYCSKYYAFKTNIKKQNNTIKKAFKICILNNLDPKFKTYLIIINDQMQKAVIKEKKTCIKSKYKSTNFAIIKLHSKPPKKIASKKEKQFVKWPKYKKYGYKY